ncbi:LOW QUALITY PROTEIN: 1-phosphatidylinositol-3-phosphate 5-kinase FAB1B-like [Salvia miltiorrhiza]|uniref:LOW QUALITY PROTEIN: 1-phosphatidylinositol-3-phosphate 5-kinase FAB1B-like n=1 Tax=Salvia miltiorrhiza TaxID=226208 RepID=UPI0025AD3962|nr:LOW QUALITY PROTEIN: 1-phosphatidylinositol-3-phosphate 5-kinase FAB1B-like [Salvia miltiorrhiza]
MDSTTENNKLSEIVDILRSWIPMRGEPGNMSRDFWMPDESCRVCYECDSSFTIFNRKHHCRLCGRVFCGRCTINTVPALPDEPKSGREDRDRIKVCNYCFKQWKQQVATGSNVVQSSPGLTPSPSSSSLVSTQSSCCTCNSGSSAGSTEFSTGPFQHVSCGVGRSPHSSTGMDSKSPKQDQARSSEKLDYLDSMDPFRHQLGSCSRSDDEDDDYPIHRSHSEINIVSPDMGYGTNNYSQIDHIYGPREAEPNEESTHATYNSSLVPENFETQGSLDYETRKEADIQTNDVQFGSAPLHVMDEADVEAVDYENNGLMWLPPEPEDEEDEREVFVSDDDDDDPCEDATGEWGYLRSSSFIVGELRNRDRSNEEHRRAMKRVVDGHFTALISQLLQAENFPASDHESWLDIITQLSWEAATLLKPDTSRGGGMDPGGYVKVKCIACGNRSESMVIKGIVCKKNVAHRRMSSKIDKARLLLLGGALEYQRVANHLSSFDTLLQQEMDHLKMAVAKIDAHHPNILLVEKSVSRYAQEYLLAKNISLVLNIKRPLLERIARCSGAQIVPSIDSLSTPKLGYCDSFHVEKFLEDLGSAGQGGKKLTKTLMFFEGCPRPLGCTILLKGASGDELKKVKHVVHYGVFAAYHLALETSFLADEGASLPELPLKSPIKVALPDKPSSVDRSISMIPGYNSPSSERPQAQQQPSNAFQSRNDMSLDSRQSSVLSMSEAESISSKGSQSEQLSDSPYSIDKNRPDANGCSDAKRLDYLDRNDTLNSKHLFETEALGQGFNFSPGDENRLPLNMDKYESVLSGQHDKDQTVELETLMDEFPPSPSDHQSILVSLSTRCVLKGSVCERAHLFRIKYYGNFDKPLGRFLRDHLFDQGSRCNSCEMPSEAHVHCYTHQQGSLTISVKRLQESFLPGEREGKIWMWHRCLRCPRTNGFPPATKRVVMSDAAWGLSFGKFLELSFSNHAAASRVASCGHSLHRDCLRFYGFGRMVACFRYAPINVYSVYLPPSMLEFNYYKEEWIQKEFDEVSSRAYVLFTEVQEVLHQISDRVKDDAGKKADESSKLIAELELMLQKEIKEFEESLWCVLKKEVKHGRPEMDILEINRTKRQLVFHAYVWDQRLMHFSKYKVSTLKEKPLGVREKRSEVETISRSSRGFTSWDSSFAVMTPYLMPNEGEDSRIVCPDEIHKGMDIDQPSRNKEDSNLYRSDTNLSNQSDIPEYAKTVRRARSEGQFPVMENTSDNLDTAWTVNQQPEHVYSEDKKTITPNTSIRESSGAFSTTTGPVVVGRCRNDRSVGEETNHLRSGLPAKGPNDIENPRSWLSIPFSALYRSLFNKNTPTTLQKLGKIAEYNPVYISSFRELVHLGGARLLLPTAGSDIVVPIYDDEPTSVISYTLVSPEYQNFMAEEPDKQKNYLEPSSSFSLLDPVNLFSFSSFDESNSEAMKGLGSADESILSSGSRSFSGLDSLLYPSTLHSRISFTDDGPPGKVKYSVTCYFAKQFEALRKACCSSELDFIRSLSRCKKWGAQGGKSNVFFAKTLDDRFIIKQVTKTELESFTKFAPSYFKYLSESISVGCPTCLAKILGIYQVTSKHLKGGKETRMDVLVMENLLYRRNITRLYDLKGSARSRYNPDSSGSNKVLLDQNLIEAMPTSPIFLGTKAKRLLERAVWNDTSFLASIDVMDYSLLVGVDEEKHELVLGIIDFMRQYTWDKHLETWVKASGILGGPKNASPTIISPKQYKKRFRKAMSAYFLMVPDQWLSSTILPSSSHSDQHEENSQDKVTIQ